MSVGVSPRLRSPELEPCASELSRGKAVECCRIVDQNLLLDRRIECPLRQLVEPARPNVRRTPQTVGNRIKKHAKNPWLFAPDLRPQLFFGAAVPLGNWIEVDD